jgi:hypothetical protein
VSKKAQADFDFSQSGIFRHVPCGTKADTIGGDIEMSFCPHDCQLDMQAVQALEAALQAFKATGHVAESAPVFDELHGRRAERRQIPGPHLRAWEFDVVFETDEDEDTFEDTFSAYIILTPEGDYKVINRND